MSAIARDLLMHAALTFCDNAGRHAWERVHERWLTRQDKPTPQDEEPWWTNRARREASA